MLIKNQKCSKRGKNLTFTPELRWVTAHLLLTVMSHLRWLELQKRLRPHSLTNVRRLQPPPAPVFESLPSCALFSLYCRIKRHESIEWDYILLAAAYSIFLAF